MKKKKKGGGGGYVISFQRLKIRKFFGIKMYE